jgi:hypothetical protein
LACARLRNQRSGFRDAVQSDERAEPRTAFEPEQRLVDRLEPVELDAGAAVRSGLGEILVARDRPAGIQNGVLDDIGGWIRRRWEGKKEG